MPTGSKREGKMVVAKYEFRQWPKLERERETLDTVGEREEKLERS